MATADQLRSLARNVAREDFEASRRVLQGIAEREELKGRARLAEDIHSIMAAASRQREASLKIRGGAIHHDEQTNTWISDVDVRHHSRRSIVLSDQQQVILNTVVQEYTRAKELRHHNLEPTRKLLLCGPPGTGKTLTGAVLAAELDMPLRRINMHTLVSRYLGETAQNIAKVFEEIQLARAVYLFDEFDSISRARYSAQDSGEMDRVVNAVLLLIENDRSSSLLVATTNVGTQIDPAFARRFDEVVAYTLPDEQAIESLILLYLPERASVFSNVVSLFVGLSHADVSNTLNRIHKDLLLNSAKLTRVLIEHHVERYRAARELIGTWNTLSLPPKDEI